MQEISEPYKLIQNIVDTQKDLIVVIENETPILLNTAFMKFFNVHSFDEYTKNFGSFTQNFVPHPSYFHAEKVAKDETWIEAFFKVDEKDQIISMINQVGEPRAFKVKIDTSHTMYAVVSFEDISADLIKCIMIENNVSIDKKSGAYNKEYFLHTLESFYNGAMFNEKKIGLSMIHLEELNDADTLKGLVTKVKKVIRQNDMLIKYSQNKLLVAYLVDNLENATCFSKKLFEVIKVETPCKLVLSLVKQDEKIPSALHREESALHEIEYNELKTI